MKMMDLLKYMEQNGDNYIYSFCKDKRKITYRELCEDVLKMISFIGNEKKIKQGEYVGIVGNNSYEWIVIDLACLIGGWVSVSFHAKEFETRKEQLLEEYNMQLVFTDEEYMADSSLFICLSDALKEIQKVQTVEKNEKQFFFKDEDIFTIIYTSGTTGTPKALEINLLGVNSFINGFFDIFEFTKKDKVLVFLPLSVLTCRTYVYAAIMGGINVLLADMSTFMLAMKLGHPTILQGVPHLFETVYDMVYGVIEKDKKKKIALQLFFFLNSHHLLSKKFARRCQKKFLKPFYDFWGGEMRLMITGSASIGTNILRFYNNAGIPLYEAYGINEGGVLAINCPENVKIGSVGRPFMGRKIMIANDGEVLVKKDEYVFSSGYKDKKLMEEQDVFREDGYIATGDIGYFDQDGFLYLKGRKKEIITMSNGEKVMPAQMENAIKELASIKQICICGNEKSFLTAIVSPVNKETTDKDVLNQISQLAKQDKNIEKIKSVIIAKEPFSIENKMLNVNLKLARKEIVAFYKNELAEIYG